MKPAAIPSIRVDPALRGLAQAEFIARGMAARDEADRTDNYHAAADVHKEIAALVTGALSFATSAKTITSTEAVVSASRRS